MGFASRIKTWIAGDTVSASDLNGEFNIAINALSDGTKDVNVSAANAASLGVSGVSVLSGNVTSGNITGAGLFTCANLNVNANTVLGTNASNTITLNGNVSAAANVVVVNNLTAPNILLNTNVAANVNVGGILRVTGNVNAAAEANIVGNANVAGNLLVTGTAGTGNLTVTGALSVTGNTTLGDNVADALTITANTATISQGFANNCAAKRSRANGATAAIGEIAISSANSGSFTSTSSTNTNVTSLIVNITTSGRPVWVGLLAENAIDASSVISVETNSGHTNAVAIFYIKETTIASTPFTVVGRYALQIVESSDATEASLKTVVPASVLHGIHFVAAGSYTYIVQVNVPDNGDTATVSASKLVAYEL